MQSTLFELEMTFSTNTGDTISTFPPHSNNYWTLFFFTLEFWDQAALCQHRRVLLLLVLTAILANHDKRKRNHSCLQTEGANSRDKMALSML